MNNKHTINFQVTSNYPQGTRQTWPTTGRIHTRDRSYTQHEHIINTVKKLQKWKERLLNCKSFLNPKETKSKPSTNRIPCWKMRISLSWVSKRFAHSKDDLFTFGVSLVWRNKQRTFSNVWRNFQNRKCLYHKVNFFLTWVFENLRFS